MTQNEIDILLTQTQYATNITEKLNIVCFYCTFIEHRDDERISCQITPE